MQAEQVPIGCHLSRLLSPADHSYKDILQDPPKEELMYMPLHQESGQTGVKDWPELAGMSPACGRALAMLARG